MPDPTWQALYRAALVESDPIKLNGRIEAARRSIGQRLERSKIPILASVNSQSEVIRSD